MKKRAIILNISLVILLVVSLTENFILFNKFNMIRGLQNELEASRVELQNAQLDWETLETDLAEAQEENIRLVALKDGSSATLSSISLPDPNKILKSGKTLLEAKIMIEEQMDSFRKSGYNDEDRLNRAADMMARDFGTTLDEISRCPNVEVKEQPTQKNTQKPSTQQPSQQVQQPSGGSQLPVEADKDRNGRLDALEEVEAGEGTIISDPDFNVGTPGDLDGNGVDDDQEYNPWDIPGGRIMGVPGHFPKTPEDKDGNGIDDGFEAERGVIKTGPDFE